MSTRYRLLSVFWVFGVLLSIGCSSKDDLESGDIGGGDKQDVSYDIHHEAPDIDELSDSALESKDSELQEDVKEDQDSEVEGLDADADADADVKDDANVDEEYEQKFQEIEKYYATRMPGLLTQYKQWLIVQPTFNFMNVDEYRIDALVYRKDSSHQLSKFLSDPDHQYLSSGARPIIHENYLFIVGPTVTMPPEGNNVVMSIRVYDLDLLPGDAFLQEVYLNNPVVGSDSWGFGCSRALQFESETTFDLIGNSVFVSCSGRLIEFPLVKDESGKFKNEGNNRLVYEGNIIPYVFEAVDKKVYLMLKGEKDVYELNQDGMPIKVSSLQLPQYEARGELVQPGLTNTNTKPEWIGNYLWVPTTQGPFAAVFEMSNPHAPQFLHYTHTWAELLSIESNDSYVFALVRSRSSECREELFDEYCLEAAYDVMVYDKSSPAPVSSVFNVIKLDTDDDGFDNYQNIHDIVFDYPMLYLTQTHRYDQDESTQRGILKLDLSERLSELPF